MINAPFSCWSLVAIFENCSGSSSTSVPAALTAIAAAVVAAVALILITFPKAICVFNAYCCFVGGCVFF